jgi:dolichyl-phosphate-mannose-protein mannosyltransferase
MASLASSLTRAQYYINRTFYFDVHPPLGKMLVGFAGALSGFNGSFDFPSGATYPDFVPFRTMRILMAMPGVAMVPLTWGTAVELGFSGWGRHIVTLMVLCGALAALSEPRPIYSACSADVALLVICRFVLLDSLLLFFTFCVVYCLACFHNEQRRCRCRRTCKARRLTSRTDHSPSTGGSGSP